VKGLNLERNDMKTTKELENNSHDAPINAKIVDFDYKQVECSVTYTDGYGYGVSVAQSDPMVYDSSCEVESEYIKSSDDIINKYYVNCYRYMHNICVYCTTDYSIAKLIAEAYDYYRGGKYDVKIDEHDTNCEMMLMDSDKTAKVLKFYYEQCI